VVVRCSLTPGLGPTVSFPVNFSIDPSTGPQGKRRVAMKSQYGSPQGTLDRDCEPAVSLTNQPRMAFATLKLNSSIVGVSNKFGPKMVNTYLVVVMGNPR